MESNRPHKPASAWPAILLAEGAVVLLLVIFSPYLVTELAVDRAAGREKASEVEKREAERLRVERAERDRKPVVRREADALKKELVERHKKDVRKNADILRKIGQDLEKKRRELEREVGARPVADLYARLQAVLGRQILEMKARSETCRSNSPDLRPAQAIQAAELMESQNGKLLEDPRRIAAEMKTVADATAAGFFALIKESEGIPDPAERRLRFGVEIEIHLVLRKVFEIQQTLEKILGLQTENANNLANLPPQPPPAEPGAFEDSLPGQLESAEAAGQAIQDQLTAIRAMELALLDGIPVDEALEKVTPIPPQTSVPDIRGALAAEVGTLGELDAFRQELAGASAATSAMVRGSRNALARAGAPKNQIDASVVRAARAAAGLERAPGVVADLSGLMKSAAGGFSPGGGGDPGQSAGGDGGWSIAGEKNFNGSRGGTGGWMGGDSMRNDQQGGAGTAGVVRSSKALLDTARITAQALPGRKFNSRSARRGWLYLDTWYVIGPWENNGRIDYETIHPPEFEIDFSKTYPGGKSKDRGGVPRELRWQFTQSSSVKVIPPDEASDSTFYAYTEVHFEEANDMLLAIASDDAAKVWINGILVWEDRGLGAWSLDEGFRKVHFAAGHNSLLVRIENGPTLCNFSVLLCPAGD
jgi:hypothetical protein